MTRYEADVRSFLRQRIRDHATADDLAQEVFLGAMKSIAGFKYDSTVRSWLISIARYKLIDFLRSNKRRKTVQNDVDLILDQAVLSQAENLDQDVTDVLETLNDCLQLLQPRARQLVDEYYFRDMTAQQIAIQNDQKPGTVRMTLLRIRRLLARCIAQRTGRGER